MRIKNLCLTAIVASFVFIWTTCGRGKIEWKGSIEKANGVTLIKNPNQGLWDSKENAGVKLIQERHIGEPDGPDELLFDFVADVTVNSQGDVYIADRKLNEIRKFSKEGKYLLTIGRQGQGPGEFQSIRTLGTNIHGDLMAFDGRLGRISVFSEDGEHKATTKKLLVDSWIDVSRIIPWGENAVLMGKMSNSLKLFHEFDRDWSLKGSYMDYQFVDHKEFEEQSLGFSPGNCHFQKNGDVLYSKFHYDNQIFLYRKNELLRIISRESDIKKPYEVQVFHDVQKAMAIRDPEYDFKSFGQGAAYVGKTHQSSIGIFSMSNGDIVNFLSLRRSKDLWELGVELYDSDGKFLKYTKLGDNLFYDIRCQDSNDLFYAIQRKEFHMVVIFRLRY
jgi:hypothetical protein